MTARHLGNTAYRINTSALATYRTVLTILVVSFSILTSASATDFQDPMIEQAIQTETSMIDAIHSRIGNTVRTTADRLDLLFSDEEIPENAQKSQLRFKPSLKWSEIDGWHHETPLQLILILPRTNKRLKLVVDRLYTDNVDQMTDYDELPPPPEPKEEDTSTFIGLQYEPIYKISRNLRFLLGPRIKGTTAYLYGAVKGRLTFRLGAKWKLKLKQSLFYDQNEFGEETGIIFQRPIGLKNIFSFSNYGEITEHSTNGMDLSHSLAIKHLLWKNAGIQFYTTMNAHTDDSTIADEYVVGTAYHQSIWKDWIIFRISPNAVFPRSHDYQFTQEYKVSMEFRF